MRGWAVGTGTAALALAVGATWWVTKVDDIRVVDDAQATTPSTNSLSQDPSTSSTTTSSTPASSTTVPEVPPCRIAEGRATGDPAEDWATIVVDTAQGLPASFSPPDLVNTAEAGFDTGDEVRAIVIDDLARLRRAAHGNRTPIDLVSAYRSYVRQAQLFAAEAESVGEEEARRTTARPGHSEHQLGTAVDVLALGDGELTTDFGETPTGRWLAGNSWRYGFVISFPEGASDRSCYSYEPWHLRYVGRDLAREIQESGLAAREYLLTHPG